MDNLSYEVPRQCSPPRPPAIVMGARLELTRWPVKGHKQNDETYVYCILCNV